MKTYDFIFSNRPRHRISRHAIFWLSWFVFVVLTYQIPMGDVFPNWNIRARMAFAQKTHGVDFITLRGGLANMIWEITYKQLRLVLCHAAFTYAVIYYILPRYISNGKKWIITTGKLLLIFTAFLALQYFVVYRNIVDGVAEWASRGVAPKSFPKTTAGRIITQVARVTIFNLSTLVGITIGVKLLKRWWLKQKETEQVAREKLNAELQLLKAQIHPHFLFNSLNNIYAFALEGSPRTPEMIQKLSGLLHYMLYECKQPLVPLERELAMIQDYIALEKIRYGERLKMEMQIPPVNTHQMIAPLLLIPFVENSFKHGTSKMLSRPEITLSITVLESILYFKLKNSRPARIEDPGVIGKRGVGLKNVQKRLSLLYTGRHELQIIDDPAAYTVWLKIVLAGPTSSKINIAHKKEMTGYELA